MKKPQLRKRRTLAPSQLSEPLVGLGRRLLPFYLRFALSFSGIEVREPELIAAALEDFRMGRTRLIAAFRHPYGDEPQLLFHLFENIMPAYDKNKRRIHMRFLHDYAVPLWGGAFINFILPRAGALPVYHVKYNADSLKNIRSLLRDGPWVVGIAPEGQISYHSETLPRIEPGTVHLGLRCAGELAKAGRSEKVIILPLSVHYRYDTRDIKKISAALAQLERQCGMESEPVRDPTPQVLMARAEAIETRVLDMTEAYYAQTYGFSPDKEEDSRQLRWRALLPAALDVAEHMLGIDLINNKNNTDSENIMQRMYKVRLEGWNRVSPEDLPEDMSALEEAFAQRRAGEGRHAMKHMEFVDLMAYHDADYYTPDFDRVAETVLNLQDLVNRLTGGNISNRPNNIRKKAVIIPGPCMDLTERLDAFRAKPRQTVSDATGDLARIYEDCIKQYRSGKQIKD
ncbi:MAG: 1-acyl-sn-glycerol-3-phosphate acyltransferase [Eubacteriales bacterium]|jgi:hypothetical protein|nr:1-acyl-sn-glycerol-3-phosphate acyltransferase [Eubacteriales bacterium]